jgi:hypothetical protein
MQGGGASQTVPVPQKISGFNAGLRAKLPDDIFLLQDLLMMIKEGFCTSVLA